VDWNQSSLYCASLSRHFFTTAIIAAEANRRLCAASRENFVTHSLLLEVGLILRLVCFTF
jgi:hypothetical protein